ncbi:MAG: radical SAM protein [bacterium]|nr:radical SAM protein [bacterium]
MAVINKTPNTREKLQILSQDSQYDLACACSMQDADRRHRSKDDKWVYPVVLPDKREVLLFKTLMSNVCANDCKYCPLREENDQRRCAIPPEELAKVFLEYYNAGRVMGLFLSSGVIGTPDNTMLKINETASILRKQGFRGYIHLKVIPGASDEAIRHSVTLANAVSVNIETAGEKHFSNLSTKKNYIKDIIHPMQLISKLTEKGSRYSRVSQTTQFIVGASDETDKEIVKYSWGLYKKLNLNRVYFSAYQRGLGKPDLPGELSPRTNDEILTREHRLYQVDWLVRKYNFREDEIPFDPTGNLSLIADPKEIWAKSHPEFFPVNINKANKYELLRVPGFGLITSDLILQARGEGSKIKSIEDLGRPGKRLKKAETYIKFN